MPAPKYDFKTTNISLATSLLCTEYGVAGADDVVRLVERGACFVLLSTDVVPGSNHCEFTLGYSDMVEFEIKSVAFRAGTLLVPPVHYDKKKKSVVDGMRIARNQTKNEED